MLISDCGDGDPHSMSLLLFHRITHSCGDGHCLSVDHTNYKNLPASSHLSFHLHHHCNYNHCPFLLNWLNYIIFSHILITMSLPSNVHVSSHPVLKQKFAQLRQKSSGRETRQLIHEISTILSVWVSSIEFKNDTSAASKTAISAAGAEFTLPSIVPADYVLIPVLRSGLGMVDSFLTFLPNSESPIYHLGIFREKISLQPVEYYNKLPTREVPFDIAFVLDPIIATGGTAEAVIQTLRDWGVKKIVFVSLLGSAQGLKRVIESDSGDLEIYIGEVDEQLSETGFILPGVGDLGDRLHNTHLD